LACASSLLPITLYWFKRAPLRIARSGLRSDPTSGRGHMSMNRRANSFWIGLSSTAIVLTIGASAIAQLDPRRGPPGCVPASERQMQRGCYILVSHRLGELPRAPLFWHIDAFRSRSDAEAAKGPRSTVVEALGRVWLMTVDEAAYRPQGGERTASVGPLTTSAGTSYTATYMEGIMLPGAETGVHHHPGPEAIYTLAGEECMETPAGKFMGRRDGLPIIVPAGVPHRLSIIGAEERRALALVLHDSSQLWAIRTHEHGWTPKGLCHHE
jgi:quercetin dioxygenase-like cupin family protein